MIAVSSHKVGDIAGGESFKRSCIRDIRFLIVFVKDFIQDQDPHPVTQVQEFRCSNIMAIADSIAPHVFEELQLAFHRPWIKGATKWSMVMMKIDTFDLYSSVVEIKTVIGSKPHRSDSKWSVISVCNDGPSFHFSAKGVHDSLINI